MKKVHYCTDCGRKQEHGECCPGCRAEKRRLAAIHALFNAAIEAPADAEERERRVGVYAARAAAGQDLFGEGA